MRQRFGYIIFNKLVEGDVKITDVPNTIYIRNKTFFFSEKDSYIFLSQDFKNLLSSKQIGLAYPDWNNFVENANLVKRINNYLGNKLSKKSLPVTDDSKLLEDFYEEILNTDTVVEEVLPSTKEEVKKKTKNDKAYKEIEKHLKSKRVKEKTKKAAAVKEEPQTQDEEIEIIDDLQIDSKIFKTI